MHLYSECPGKEKAMVKKLRNSSFLNPKDGHKKDRNGMDLREAEDIKKRWQEYTTIQKKIFMTQITTMV